MSDYAFDWTEEISPAELGECYQEALDGTEPHYDFSGRIGGGPHNPGKAKHPGFKAVQASIAKKQGVSAKRAGAILAAGSRGASKAAKKKNPRLKRVKGK
jgi:hypothetical protein